MKKKILVTGSNGFLGKELREYLSRDKYDICFTTRQTLDVTNKEEVKKFFVDNGYFDIVIHTATKGGIRGVKDTESDFIQNLLMLSNLSQNTLYYGKLFTFCSGASFGRKNDIKRIKEEAVYKGPFKGDDDDYYGFSKYIISNFAKNKEYIYSFRLFGCFGKNESETRLVKSSINKIKNGEKPVIHQDKEMDYISSKDVIKILEYYIDSTKDLPRNINLVYEKKVKLSDIVSKISSFTSFGESAIILESSSGKSYSGNGKKLKKLRISLDGLDKGLMEMCSDSY